MRRSLDLVTALARSRSNSGAMSCMAADLAANSLPLANSNFLCNASRCSCSGELGHNVASGDSCHSSLTPVTSENSVPLTEPLTDLVAAGPLRINTNL